MSAARCGNCGTTLPWAADTRPPTVSCPACPPCACEDCGAVETHDEPCDCWRHLDGMTTADLKTLFALNNLTIGALS